MTHNGSKWAGNDPGETLRFLRMCISAPLSKQLYGKEVLEATDKPLPQGGLGSSFS